jgi:hypothetical protein
MAVEITGIICGTIAFLVLLIGVAAVVVGARAEVFDSAKALVDDSKSA